MTQLYCYAADDGRVLWRATQLQAVIDRLADINVRYAHIDLPATRLDRLANTDEVIEAFREHLDGLMQDDGFISLDVSAVHGAQPDQSTLHRRFMAARAYAGVQGHLMVEGDGAFFMRSGSRVLALHCQAGDYIRVPAGLRHWFDMGRAPDFRSIRLYTDAGELDIPGVRQDMRGLFPSPQAVA